MVSRDLQNECNSILQKSDILDEDKIDRIEDLVREAYHDEENADIERIVLDILWAQRRGEEKDETLSEESDDERTSTEEMALESSASIDPLPNNETTPELQEELSPLEILKSIFGDGATDSSIIQALDRTGYDLQRVIELAQEPEKPQREQQELADAENIDDSEEVDERSKILCKYFVYSGQCLRSDCLYSHDPASRICKFWLKGSCLAAENCIFFHGIPEKVVENLSLNEKPPDSPPRRRLDLTDQATFPALGSTVPKKKNKKLPKIGQLTVEPKKEVSWSNVVSFRPTKPVSLQKLSTARIKLTRPKHIPWEDPEFGENAEYLKARHSARRNGELRNNYLRLAVDSWNKNEAQMAKMFSKKGQLHNEKMLEDFSNANEIISRQKDIVDGETFIDMHGNDLQNVDIHVKEKLLNLEKLTKTSLRPVYIISGAGRYDNKDNLNDNLSKTIKLYLDKNMYRWVDYHTTDKKYGQIIAVDIYSHL